MGFALCGKALRHFDLSKFEIILSKSRKTKSKPIIWSFIIRNALAAPLPGPDKAICVRRLSLKSDAE